ncbi:MAG: MFS transporter [Micrococcaceae bacterium]
MVTREEGADGAGARLFGRSYLLANGVQLGISVVFISLMTYMALYAVRLFAVSETAAGFAASSFILGAAVVRLALGKFIDLIGRRRMLLIALVVFLGCCLLYPVALSYPALLGVRLLHGAAFGTASTAITAVAIALIPPARRSEGLGYFGLSATIATAVGPLVAVPMSLYLDPVWMFAFVAGIAALTLVCLLLMRVPERAVTAAERASVWRIRARDLIDPQALPVSLVVLLCSGGYSMIMTYLTPFLVLQDQALAATVFFVLFAVTMMLVRLVAGRLQDTRGDNAVIPVTILSFAAALVLLALSQQWWAVVVSAVLAGIGFGGLLPCLQVVGVNRVTGDRVAIATSTHYLMLDGGIAIGPVVLGPLIVLTGYPGLFLAGAVLAVLGVVVYWWVHGRHTATPRPVAGA